MMELSELSERIKSAGLRGCRYSEADLKELESHRRAPIPEWYRNTVLGHPIANLHYRFVSDDPDFTIDFVIPHPAEMRALAVQHHLFCDHSHQMFDSFRSAWFPFGVAADGSSIPLWVIRADNDSDRLIYEFHDDMWDPMSSNAPGNGAFSVGSVFESVLTRATVIEHVTSDPFAPKASDLRFESSVPPVKSLIKIAPTTK